jgi:hypothetical protein
MTWWDLTRRWLSGSEDAPEPAAIYRRLLERRREAYSEVRERAAQICYAAQRARAEVDRQRMQLARCAYEVRRGRASAILLDAARSALGRAEAELDAVQKDADEAKRTLVALGQSIRDLELEAVRVRAAGAALEIDLRARAMTSDPLLDEARAALTRIETHRELALALGGV